MSFVLFPTSIANATVSSRAFIDVPCSLPAEVLFSQNLLKWKRKAMYTGMYEQYKLELTDSLCICDFRRRSHLETNQFVFRYTVWQKKNVHGWSVSPLTTWGLQCLIPVVLAYLNVKQSVDYILATVWLCICVREHFN